MSRPVWLPPLLVVASAALLGGLAATATPKQGAPVYDSAGRLLPPGDYRQWVFLSAGVDMSYSAAPAMAAGHMFDNVFAPRPAYAYFLAHGTWPDRTVLILENRGGTGAGSINKRGLYQTGAVLGLEAHVKDARLPGGFGFFSFEDGGPAKKLPVGASCYACHQAHGAVQTTFAQFYPVLLRMAMSHHTLDRPAELSGAAPNP